jgi:homoserine dehydrogenase
LGYGSSEIPYFIFLNSCSMRLAVRPFWALVDSDNYDQSYSFLFSTLQTVELAASKEMIDKLKATLSHGAIVVTPDSDNYDESFKRWSAAAEKNPVSFNLSHSSPSESYLVS